MRRLVVRYRGLQGEPEPVVVIWELDGPLSDLEVIEEATDDLAIQLAGAPRGARIELEVEECSPST